MLLRLLDMSTSKRIDVYTKTIILREFCNIYKRQLNRSIETRLDHP